MRSLIILIVIAAFAAVPFVRAADTTPSPSPEASATPAKKHSKKAAASAAATATPASNPAAPSTTPAAKPHKAPEPQAAQAPGGGNGQVWVNTETHVYHKEGSKWYGKTKKGKYLSEADAVKEGDKPAKNEKQ
jgi:predicted lipid-binding transport protein (Tim44 family)